MKTYQVLGWGLVAATLALFSGIEGAKASSPAVRVTQTPAAQAPLAVESGAIIIPALRAIGWRWLIHKLAPPVAKYTFKRWVASGMTRCSNGLPSRYFCSPLPPAIRAIVLVGGSGGLVFHSTSEAGATAPVPPWYAIGLSCVTAGQGDYGPNGWTNTWYRTYDGWYYWRGHLDPFTVNRYTAGLPRC